ncbi:hypothetical protein KCU87_g44, partial [Aureobasidium melanogenum]
MLAALRNLSRICCTTRVRAIAIDCDERRRRPRLSGVKGVILSWGARIAGSPPWLLLMLLSPFELGASRNDLADTKLPACERAQERQQVLTRSDAVCTYIDLVYEGHSQKYKAGRSGNVDHVLHTIVTVALLYRPEPQVPFGQLHPPVAREPAAACARLDDSLYYLQSPLVPHPARLSVQTLVSYLPRSK